MNTWWNVLGWDPNLNMKFVHISYTSHTQPGGYFIVCLLSSDQPASQGQIQDYLLVFYACAEEVLDFGAIGDAQPVEKPCKLKGRVDPECSTM